MEAVGSVLVWLIMLAFLAAVLWLIFSTLVWVARCSRYTFAVCCAALERCARKL